jgi:hypothetical protein
MSINKNLRVQKILICSASILLLGRMHQRGEMKGKSVYCYFMMWRVVTWDTGNFRFQVSTHFKYYSLTTISDFATFFYDQELRNLLLLNIHTTHAIREGVAKTDIHQTHPHYYLTIVLNSSK